MSHDVVISVFITVGVSDIMMYSFKFGLNIHITICTTAGCVLDSFKRIHHSSSLLKDAVYWRAVTKKRRICGSQKPAFYFVRAQVGIGLKQKGGDS